MPDGRARPKDDAVPSPRGAAAGAQGLRRLGLRVTARVERYLVSNARDEVLVVRHEHHRPGEALHAVGQRGD
jgi:hypothetical protein